MGTLSKQPSTCAPAGAPTGAEWRSARKIAEAFGIPKRKVYRMARRQRWRRRNWGNRWFFLPPEDLKARLEVRVKSNPPAVLPTFLYDPSPRWAGGKYAMMTDDKLWSARQIASAIGTSKSQVRRLARRQHWPRRKRGNRYLYLLPDQLRARLEPVLQPRAQPIFPPRITPAEAARTQRTWWRFQALHRLSDHQRSGIGTERALRQTAAEFQGPSLFHASATSLRRWGVAYALQGFQGIQEHKAGRVGRKRSTSVTGGGLAAS
jgi:hypothetical protein